MWFCFRLLNIILILYLGNDCPKVGASVVKSLSREKGYRFVAYTKLLTQYGNKVKMVAITHISNGIGTVNPIKKMMISPIGGALFLVDGAQAVAHTSVDVQKLDCDFYVFSAHRPSPTALGVLKERSAVRQNTSLSGGGT